MRRRNWKGMALAAVAVSVGAVAGCSDSFTAPVDAAVDTPDVAVLSRGAASGPGVLIPSIDADCNSSGAFQKFPAAFADEGTLTLTTAGCVSLGVPDLFWNFDRYGLERTEGGSLEAITTASAVLQPYDMDDGGQVVVTTRLPPSGSYKDVTDFNFSSRMLLNASPGGQDIEINLWRYTRSTRVGGSITATNLRGNPATCTVKASLSNLTRDGFYYLYYNYDNEAPMLIASGRATRRGTLSMSGPLSKAEFGAKELDRFFVTESPLYIGTGPFTAATGMRIFEGKLSAARCN
jgi:hypothetical protein